MRRQHLLLVLLLLAAAAAKPDGGAVVFTANSQSLLFTVFITPAPVHAGQADLSVLVQRESDRTPVLNAQVTAFLATPGTDPVAIALTHAAATDKLLYAASVDLPRAGTYQLDVQTRTAKVSGNLVVLPEEAPLITYWPYFVIVPIVIGLFILNRYLESQRRQTTRSN